MEKLNITVNLLGYLMWYPSSRGKEHQLQVDKGAKVVDVLNKLNVPPEQVHTILKNGKYIDKNEELCEGDVITIIPVVAGG